MKAFRAIGYGRRAAGTAIVARAFCRRRKHAIAAAHPRRATAHAKRDTHARFFWIHFTIPVAIAEVLKANTVITAYGGDLVYRWEVETIIAVGTAVAARET